MSRRRKKTHRLGFVDFCRITSAGDVHCNTDPRVRELIGKTRWIPREDDDWECLEWDKTKKNSKGGQLKTIHGCKRVKKIRMYSEDVEGKPGPRTAEVGGKWSEGTTGSPFFTSTTKVHAPTWGIPPARSCPVVKTPVVEWIKDAMEKKVDLKPKEMINRLMKEIPNKCLTCYATGGNYVYAETQNAMANRIEWWNKKKKTHAGRNEIVDTMVHAITHAGREKCTERGGCEYIPGVTPEYFRAFDAGDFQDDLDVDLWARIAHKLPKTKFWFPTTAYEGGCGGSSTSKDRMLSSLRALHRLRNVTVRPSAKGLDVPAAKIAGLGAGTAVVESDTAEKGVRYRQSLSARHRGKRLATLCDKETGNCSTHFVCPGSCTLCRKCWSKDKQVVYRRHGMEAKPEHILNLVRKVTGVSAERTSSKKAVFAEVDLKARNDLMTLFAKMYPGPEEQKLRMREWGKVVRKATTPRAEEMTEIEEMRLPNVRYISDEKLAAEKAEKAYRKAAKMEERKAIQAARKEEKLRLRAEKIAARAAKRGE